MNWQLFCQQPIAALRHDKPLHATRETHAREGRRWASRNRLEIASLDNIAFFNRLTLGLFAKLYESFPSPIDIDVQALAKDMIPEEEESSIVWNSLKAAEDAVDFLADEGFLTHKGKYLEGGTVLQARLTLRGLAILGSTPDSLEGKIPLIDRIKRVLAGGAKEGGSEVVKQLAQQAYAAALAAGPAIAASMAFK